MQHEPIDLVRRDRRDGKPEEPGRLLLLAGPHLGATDEPADANAGPRLAARLSSSRRRRLAFALAIAVVAGSWMTACQDATETSRPPLPGLVPGALIGYEATGVRSETYAPGTSRTLPVSEGLYQVTVLAGTLSVEDHAGGRWEYPAGRSYVAGWAPYRAINLTAAPVQITVTDLGRP